MTELGIGVVGLGVGEQHARAYSKITGCRLRWLCDLDVRKAKRVAEELGQGQATSRYEDMLEDPSVAAVSIASFDDAHFAQVLAALSADKHVFVEKPLCRSGEELHLLHASWRKKQELVLDSNFVLRAAPFYRWLKSQIAGGELGRIYALDGDYLYGRLEKITAGWRKDVADYSVFVGGGCHLVDQLLWLSGERPGWVQAAGNQLCTEGSAFRYADFVAATYGFPSGLIARVTANFGCTHPHQHVLRVFGQKATVLYDDQGPRTHQTRDEGTRPNPLDLSPFPPSKGALIAGFIRAIREGADIATTQQHFDVISACLAADQAAARGERVQIEYLS